MKHCIQRCIALLSNDLHRQCFKCQRPTHNIKECPSLCRDKNKVLLHVDSKQMNLLAVLEVRTYHSESWTGLFCLKKGKLCSLMFGLLIMMLVMASYILTGAKRGLLLMQPALRYGAFTSSSNLMDNESFCDMKDHYQTSKMNISYAKDYPSIKVIIDTITTNIEFITRHLPDLEDLKKQEMHMFSVIPNKFLPNSKNPCWYEEYKGNTTRDPYATNSYALYSKRFRTIFDYLRKVFWSHLYHYKEKHYRLRCLPHFYIIGQPKCGTTDLYDRLRLHPDVRFSAIKEPHWWTRKRFGIIRLRDGFHDRYPVEDYLDLFDLAAHQIQSVLQGDTAKDFNKIIIGEASASTMWDNNAWIFFYDNSTEGEPPFLIQDFIHAFQPNAKLIVMLRDPVERLYSDYLYFANANKSVEDFHEKVAESLQLFENCLADYSLRACVYNNTINNAMPVRLQVGLYVVFLLDWLTVFNKDQILVLRLEDHASNVKFTMHMVFQFLDLGALSEKEEALITKSPASNTRRPEDRNLGPMLPITKEILRDFYQPFNTKLAQVLSDEAFLWKKS
ncbi:carbohydrate sulfotransferase 15 [Podarcis raffonei]|uniref:carbohydrate sulfotransferase 15 n=1 Tax=Podarcis raffonei TaxID=65483 RepID=UPI00232902A9|nr:carbohydrate sulfotransferase 15 [Podarcis raffonei]